MKLCLFIGVSFILCAFQVSSLSDKKQKDVRKSVNEFRKKFADLEKIDDMNELTDNPDLEQKSNEYSTCDNYKLLKNMSIYFPSNAEIIDEFFEVYIAQNKSQKIKTKFGFDHVLNPSFRSIGCSFFNEICTETVMYQNEEFYKMTTVETNGICFLSEEIYCPDETEENGICKFITKSESSELRRYFSMIGLIFVVLNFI